MEAFRTIVINKPEGVVELKLTEPSFEVYGLAMTAGETQTGKFNAIAAGGIVLDACCYEGLDEVKKDVKAHVSAAIEAYGLLNVYTGEIKKN